MYFEHDDETETLPRALLYHCYEEDSATPLWRAAAHASLSPSLSSAAAATSPSNAAGHTSATAATSTSASAVAAAGTDDAAAHTSIAAAAAAADAGATTSADKEDAEGYDEVRDQLKVAYDKVNDDDDNHDIVMRDLNCREYRNAIQHEQWDKPMIDGGSVLRRACILRDFGKATRLSEEFKIAFDSESDQHWAANSDEAELAFLLASSTHPLLAACFIDAGTSVIGTIHHNGDEVTALRRMCGADAGPQGQPQLIQ